MEADYTSTFDSPAFFRSSRDDWLACAAGWRRSVVSWWWTSRSTNKPD